MRRDSYLFTLYRNGHAENRTYDTITTDSEAYEMAEELEKCLKLDKVTIFRQHVEWHCIGEREDGELTI
ncbi:hypothetical protein GMA92_13970 [Turicibacter sanguinis]|jgi:hypothetical protein|uniref:Uncharacterized protein n=1 Tax=Turicibacter sanguinis TaxID=154288 RepID=A0A9X4XFP6_9FIRM|nr:hypothetical protein [uncultured Turicibacter sp.]MTK22519.1 hypothetical protein [Turicibacter sanguinis]MTK73654.1 hypothetical protein [Turicibacter sanguinis]